MKTTIAIFTLAVAFFAAASLSSSITGNIRFAWNYDTNSEPVTSNLVFSVYYTTDLQTPIAQWPLLTNLPAPAAVDTNGFGTNFQVSATVPPGHYYFTMTASNFWGETSITSNVVQTPPLPQIINTLQIQKLP